MFQTLFLVVCTVWAASEIAIGSRLRTKIEPSRDAGTMGLVLGVGYASVALGVYLAVADDGVLARPSVVGIVGLVAIVAGLIIRAYAIVTLRHFFTVNVTVRDDHRLIRSGPYRFVRHPSYTGSLLSFYGLALAVENVWAATILIVPITVAFLIRIRVEEAVLRNAFPSEYPEYERSTSRLVPFLY
jgi:protein-S-isoprenylcysteine O-methyltransferase